MGENQLNHFFSFAALIFARLALVILPYFFRTPLLISALTFSICAPLGNILKRTILTASPKPLPALKKSLNCMGLNMSPVQVCGKVSKCDLGKRRMAGVGVSTTDRLQTPSTASAFHRQLHSRSHQPRLRSSSFRRCQMGG